MHPSQIANADIDIHTQIPFTIGDSGDWWCKADKLMVPEPKYYSPQLLKRRLVQ